VAWLSEDRLCTYCHADRGKSWVGAPIAAHLFVMFLRGPLPIHRTHDCDSCIRAGVYMSYCGHGASTCVKWFCLFVQAVCGLLAIALIQSGDRLESAITMGLFASGVAACVLLVAAHDRPFTGHISVAPTPLLQVMPEAAATVHASAGTPE
jgi:hypothetical protein